MSLTPAILRGDADPCWEGYQQIGMKRQGKKRVPNCVPIAKRDSPWAVGFDADDGKKYTKVVTNPETGRKNRVRYGAKGYTIAPGTDKGDRYCARSFGDMKSHGKDCSGPDRNTPLCLSRAKWKCSGKTSRRDAPESTQGKPCGKSHIPKDHKCSKGTGSLTPNNLRNAAKVALAAGLLTGGAYLAKRKFQSMEEWRKSSANPRNNPKLSPERAQQITDEAIADGQKWDVQERINARRRAEIQAECGGGLGKLTAPAKFDALVPKPRCQAGEGAFGTYFVHPSEQYGVKLYRNGDEDDVDWEFDRLGRAWAADVNVPKPLSMNSTVDQNGDIRTQTLVLSHMKGYKMLADVYGPGYNIDSAPAIVKIKLAREFRKLHVEGLAHGDIHGGNIMVHPRSKKVALIDFGYSTAIDDRYHPVHGRTGVQNLMGDLRRLPEFLGYEGISHTEFLERSKGILNNIETQANDYSRSWEKFELAINRYHDFLEKDLLWEDRMPRSRFVRSFDQPRIPGLTRRILTAAANTKERDMMLHEAINRGVDIGVFAERARNLGLKPPQLFRALKPERDARLAARKKKPYGTPIPRPATTA